MKQERSYSSISALAALLVLAVFAAGLFAVLLSGAQGYQRLFYRDTEAYNRRTCVQYISTKIRQSSSGQSVELADFGDGQALLIHQSIEGKDYISRVYCYDGWLMELFSAAGSDVSPQDGEQMLPLSGLSIQESEGLLSFTLTEADGDMESFYLSLRGEAAA